MPEYAEEYEEEPIYIKRCRRRRRRHHHHHHHRPPAPLPPIIIPIPIQAPPEEVPLQVTEYVQDIYPPAEVYMDQVPVVIRVSSLSASPSSAESFFQGYMSNNSMISQPPMVHTQQTTHCQQGMILPPAPYQGHQQIVQQLSTGQMVQRPLMVGGGGGPGVQTVMSQQNLIPISNSSNFVNTLPAGTQFMS